MKVIYEKLGPWAEEPKQGTPLSNGFDLFSQMDALINPGETVMIRTGIAIELPTWKTGVAFAFVVPRSGLAANENITVVNSPGLIDTDYRGEIKVIMHKLAGEPYQVKKGDKIAQLVILEQPRGITFERGTITKTKRGKNGFGSTGR